MHAVINRLPIKPETDWSALADKIDAFNASITHPAFRGLSLIRSGTDEGIVLVLFETREALDEVSSKIAGPWFAENMRPHLAAPVSRSVGAVVAGALRHLG